VKQFLVLAIVHLIFATPAITQVGGSKVFQFLTLPSSAKSSGMGGSTISLLDKDIAAAYANPSLLDSLMDGQVTFQHQFLFESIQSGYVGFGKWIRSKDLMVHGGVKYLLYGEVDRTDEFGNILGTTDGNEIAVTIGVGHRLYDNLRIGANLKWITSKLDVYRSGGIALDLGATYIDSAGLFAVALVLTNAGLQVTSFADTREDLPVDLRLGISKRLRYLPFRFSLVYHHLNRWNLLYDDPANEEGGFFPGFELVDGSPSQFDNFARHFIVGGELLLGKAEVVRVRVGYNHQQKQELSLTNFRNLTGFSIGLGLHLKKLRFDYGLNKVHFGATTHHLGISTNLKSFIRPGIVD